MIQDSLPILALPNADAGMLIPLDEAMARNPVTAISRPMMTMAAQAGTRPRATRQMRAEAMRSLSAVGSRSWPSTVTIPFLRASQPSSQSVSEANVKMMQAMRSWPRKSVSMTATTAGMARILARLM